MSHMMSHQVCGPRLARVLRLRDGNASEIKESRELRCGTRKFTVRFRIQLHMHHTSDQCSRCAYRRSRCNGCSLWLPKRTRALRQGRSSDTRGHPGSIAQRKQRTQSALRSAPGLDRIGYMAHHCRCNRTCHSWRYSSSTRRGHHWARCQHHI